MTGHTKEPWRLNKTAISSPKPSATIARAVQGSIFGSDGVRSIGKEEAEANARRIVACVNALAGKNPAALDALIEAADRVAQARVLAREGQFDGGAFAMIGPSFEDLDTLATALANFRNGDTQ